MFPNPSHVQSCKPHNERERIGYFCMKRTLTLRTKCLNLMIEILYEGKLIVKNILAFTIFSRIWRFIDCAVKGKSAGSADNLILSIRY